MTDIDRTIGEETDAAPPADSRRALVDAAKALLWQDGYEATSPRRVLDQSGVGQGSLYHHFRGKKDLAVAALREISAEMQDGLAALDALAAEAGGRAALAAFFAEARDGAQGCRLGRLVNETAFDDAALRAPIEAFFDALEGRLAAWIASAQEAGHVTPAAEPAHLATLAAAAIQGGFVLSRARRSAAPLAVAAAAAWAVLSTEFYEQEPML